MQNLITPTDTELIAFIEDEQLNRYESHNDQHDDIVESFDDPATFLQENYNWVLSQYESKQ